MFNSVDFSILSPSTNGTYVIPDDQSQVGGNSLYNGLRSNSGVYQFTWTNPSH